MKTALPLFLLFLVCVGMMAGAAYMFINAKSEAATVAPPKLQGCIAKPDGKFDRVCSLTIKCDDGKSTCILDDGTVCVEACDPCVRLVDGKWTQVNGWQDPEGNPVTVEPAEVGP